MYMMYTYHTHIYIYIYIYTYNIYKLGLVPVDLPPGITAGDLLVLPGSGFSRPLVMTKHQQ